MRGIKENDLKRIFGEVMFNEFIAYMKGFTIFSNTKTYAKIDNEPVYYSTNVDNFLLSFFHRTFLELLYSRELKKVEKEV